MLQNLKNIAVVSLSTVGSRLLGLLRDILIFAALGTSLWNSAFILAFTLPNLFRRLLGEGALTSALVPVFSDIMEREGKAGAFRFFNQVVARLFLALCLIITTGMLLLYGASNAAWLPERWVTGAGLAVWLLPYMLCVCLAAIFSAGLNLLGRFAAAAVTPMLLNIAMIAALAAGIWMDAEAARIVYWLCGGVLVGGLFQLLLPAVDFFRQGWRPRVNFRKGEALGELWVLFIPGLMGAAILQINILVSRLLAYSLDESAVSVLYLASRLMELPLGVFTIAIATVFFPLLAKAQSTSDADGFANAFVQGIRLVAAISLPAGIGLIVLGRPIIESLFLWGAFDAGDVIATVPLLAIYGLGLPFYSIATFATRGLHARKDMRTPVRVALYCLLINFFAGISLMQIMGAAGLAAANVMAAIAQSVLLWRSIARDQRSIGFYRLKSALGKVLLAAMIMGLVCFVINAATAEFGFGQKVDAAMGVVVGVPTGVAVYMISLYFLRFEEFGMLKDLFRRFIPAPKKEN